MTKIYYGRDLIGRFTCDGKVRTRLQRMVYEAKRATKGSIIVSGAICVGAWLFVLGGYVLPAQVIFAKQEVIKEVGVKFDDIPMLVKICKAESGGKQFKTNGDVMRGIVNPSDIGYCQINEYINNDEARRLGYDIYTEQGNKDYAVYLFMTRGTEPWNSSRNVWCKGCKQFK